jgi:hypothetical protein
MLSDFLPGEKAHGETEREPAKQTAAQSHQGGATRENQKRFRSD